MIFVKRNSDLMAYYGVIQRKNTKIVGTKSTNVTFVMIYLEQIQDYGHTYRISTNMKKFSPVHFVARHLKESYYVDCMRDVFIITKKYFHAMIAEDHLKV